MKLTYENLEEYLYINLSPDMGYIEDIKEARKVYESWKDCLPDDLTVKDFMTSWNEVMEQLIEDESRHYRFI